MSTLYIFEIGDTVTLHGGLMELTLSQDHYALALDTDRGEVCDIALNYETAENLISQGLTLVALPWAVAPWTSKGLSAQQLLDQWQNVCNDSWGV
jgi:hypothetical protein